MLKLVLNFSYSMTVSETGIVLKLEGFNHKLAVSIKCRKITTLPPPLALSIAVTLFLSSAVV